MATLAVRDLSYDAIKESVMIRPDYGWCFGMGAALLWLISGFFSCCEPLAIKYCEPCKSASLGGYRWGILLTR